MYICIYIYIYIYTYTYIYIYIERERERFVCGLTAPLSRAGREGDRREPGAAGANLGAEPRPSDADVNVYDM